MKKIIMKLNKFVDLKTVKELFFFNNYNAILISQSEKRKDLHFLVQSNSFENFLNILNSIPVNSEIECLNYNFLEEFPIFLEEFLFENVYLKVQESISFLIKSNDYWACDVEIQNFIIADLISCIMSEHEDGITHGYLSYYSNLKYFLSQLKTITNKENYDLIKSKIYFCSENEQKYIEKKINLPSKILEKVEFVKKTLDEYQDFLDYSVLPNPDTFFSNSLLDLKYSKFHKEVFNNIVLLNRYKKKNFGLYRILMDIYFRMLPLLEINMIRRNHILNIAILRVEEQYHVNWKGQIEESKKMEEISDINK